MYGAPSGERPYGLTGENYEDWRSDYGGRAFQPHERIKTSAQAQWISHDSDDCAEYEKCRG